MTGRRRALSRGAAARITYHDGAHRFRSYWSRRARGNRELAPKRRVTGGSFRDTLPGMKGTAWSLAAVALAGMAGWTLAEYVIHRWLGHVFVGTRNPFTLEHRKHHATTSYFSPWWKKAIAALGALAVATSVASAVAGPMHGFAFAAGLVAMYVAYEVVHRRAHTHGPRGWYSRWVRHHHFTHHFQTPKKNHGVTSPLWDWVFGTLEPSATVRVPARHAMPWLIDPATGAVWAELAGEYLLQLRGEGPPAG